MFAKIIYHCQFEWAGKNMNNFCNYFREELFYHAAVGSTNLTLNKHGELLYTTIIGRGWEYSNVYFPSWVWIKLLHLNCRCEERCGWRSPLLGGLHCPNAVLLEIIREMYNTMTDYHWSTWDINIFWCYYPKWQFFCTSSYWEVICKQNALCYEQIFGLKTVCIIGSSYIQRTTELTWRLSISDLKNNLVHFKQMYIFCQYESSNVFATEMTEQMTLNTDGRCRVFPQCKLLNVS